MACLVLGTESSSIYILDPEAFTIMDSLELPSPPVFLSVTGLYDVEFRILVTCRLVSYHSDWKTKLCRDGALCLLKRGWPSAKLLCQLDSQPVGLLRRDKNIILACMDQTLMCLTNKVRLLAYSTLTLCDTGQASLAAEVAIINLLHRADGDPQSWPQPDRSCTLQLAPPHLRRQERGRLLPDGQPSLCDEVWQVWKGRQHPCSCHGETFSYI